MLFNSLQFLVFFPLVTTLFFYLPYSLRWMLLLVASGYFYMVFIPYYILILGFTIVVDYVAGLCIQGSEGKTRKAFLVTSLIANIGVLAIFKYSNFLSAGVIDVLQLLTGRALPHPALDLALPIGLSFHTFQAMSYTIEVYRGRQTAERHFGIYALYVMFFPQLVAGPIERPQNLLHQFHDRQEFDYGRVTDGLKLMAWGMLKKVVIADNLGVVVNQVYDRPQAYGGLYLLVATVFFAFQIYCDFSGYSDIAIGAAKVMGFRLMQNFDRPYAATSVAEFWTRWHISLSTWFRDYLYIPLGGNRVGRWRWRLNIFVVFLLSGLWHGANWTFVVWGVLHGAYLIVGDWTRAPRARVTILSGLARHPAALTAVRVGCTFALVTVAWIFFRARSMSDALYILSHLIPAASDFRAETVQATLDGLGGKVRLAVTCVSVVLLEVVQAALARTGAGERLARQPVWVRWALYYVLIMTILIFGKYSAKPSEFIYFQF